MKPVLNQLFSDDTTRFVIRSVLDHPTLVLTDQSITRNTDYQPEDVEDALLTLETYEIITFIDYDKDDIHQYAFTIADSEAAYTLRQFDNALTEIGIEIDTDIDWTRKHNRR